MANGILIENCRAEYSDNLLPATALFDNEPVVNVTSGTASLVYSDDYCFEGNKSLYCFIQSYDNTDVNFNFGTNFNTTIRNTGNHIFSWKIMNPNSTMISFVPFEMNVKIWVDSIHVDTITIISVGEKDIYQEKWVTWSQTRNFNSGEVVTFTFEVIADLSYPFPNMSFYMSALKLEFDDRFLNEPSVYSKPKDYCCSDSKGYVNSSDIGWASYVDTLHTVGSPQLVSEGITPVLMLNNAGTVISSQLPTGVVKLFDTATTKITPVAENDFNSVDIMFKVKNSVLNGYFTIYVDIPTLGARFEQTFICPKNSGTEMGVNYSFHHYVSSQFAANGGTIYIVANSGNLQIYDKQYRVARLIKAK